MIHFLRLSSLRLSILTVGTCLWLLFASLLPGSAASSDEQDMDNIRRARIMSKPWYMRKIQLGDSTTLPISPISVVVLFLTIFYLVYSWSGKQVYCVASHILLADDKKSSDKEMDTKLNEWKQRIGKDASLFAKFARKHSACPSGKQGGNLGRFPRHAMTPKFDALCFDPNTPLETTVGPIRTQFGWHLIYIHERQLEN